MSRHRTPQEQGFIDRLTRCRVRRCEMVRVSEGSPAGDREEQAQRCLDNDERCTLFCLVMSDDGPAFGRYLDKLEAERQGS